ncbi:GNAT family N-acetyltransferase [Methylobacterium sp. ID0610]|uniref:GNAT family N-acetyltransferase n=1 Tax=Methylobacterium carpenticola TaxID=3344827 RepID=UPI00367C404D
MAEASDPAVIVRACGPDDIPAVQAIYAQAVLTGRASFELDPPDLPEMRRRHAGLVEAGFPYLAALRDGELLGYAYAGPYRARPAYRGTVENSVYVDPARHGRGVGRLLLGGLIAAAEERGFRQMVAVIGDSANLASIRLHAALGFGHAGILRAVGWKHGQWLDTVLMQRALGAGDAAPPDPR